MPCNVSVRGAFQLTPSARRATGDAPGNAAASTNFNPRPPRGGRRYIISAPCCKETFQSTLSVGRATLWRYQQTEALRISIHALRGESDVGTVS